MGSLDSVRFERINGQWLFVHNIAQGETLYSLSRKFHLDIQAIEKVNDISLKPLSVDQNIYVPISEDFVKSHIVDSGETLFSIAR